MFKSSFCVTLDHEKKKMMQENRNTIKIIMFINNKYKNNRYK